MSFLLLHDKVNVQIVSRSATVSRCEDPVELGMEISPPRRESRFAAKYPCAECVERHQHRFECFGLVVSSYQRAWAWVPILCLFHALPFHRRRTHNTVGSDHGACRCCWQGGTSREGFSSIRQSPAVGPDNAYYTKYDRSLVQIFTHGVSFDGGGVRTWWEAVRAGGRLCVHPLLDKRSMKSELYGVFSHWKISRALAAGLVVRLLQGVLETTAETSPAILESMLAYLLNQMDEETREENKAVWVEKHPSRYDRANFVLVHPRVVETQSAFY